MTRYYYECPIEAAYMAKEFGVKFVDRVGNGLKPVIKFNQLTWRFVVGSDDYLRENLFVNKESETLFEPKLFDLGYCLKHDAAVIYQSFKKDEFGWIGDGKNYGLYYDEECQIIMRDGKHFFSPNKE